MARRNPPLALVPKLGSLNETAPATLKRPGARSERLVSNMITLQSNGVECECGSVRLSPIALEPGQVCICAACARAYRVAVALTPLRWSEVVEALDRLPYDLQAFEWIRNGVPELERRTLPELPLPRSGRFTLAERVGAGVGVALVVLLSALMTLRAVFS